MKTYTQHKKARKGLITILNVVIIGGFMLGMMAIAYRASIRSMEGQKKVQLQLDYEAREQAFLRSVVTLAPLYAANTMIDNSTAGSTNADEAQFTAMYEKAIDWSNLAAARDSDSIPGLDFTAYKNGNIGDTPTGVLTAFDVVGLNATETPSGVGATASDGYPDPLFSRVPAATTASKSSPLISSDITYNNASNPGDERDFKLLDYPDIHFEYAKGNFIARQNWWKLYLHANQADRDATGVGNAALDTNEYILSIYEIPSQLAISSSAITNLGKINGTAWDSSKISVEGPVYAKKANLQGGDFSGVATTEGADFDGSATVGASGAQISGHSDREAYEAANTTEFYPISRASDYARSLFLPINPGIEFFDSFATTDADQATGNRLSKESWNAYTRGCHQCKMKLIVRETVGASTTDQTPVAFSFSYEDSLGAEVTYFVHKATATQYTPEAGWIDVVWPDNDDTFPFVASSTLNGHPAIDIHIDRLIAWLEVLEPSIDFGVNHSLLVNVDYNQTTVVQPSNPIAATDLAVVLRGCNDLIKFDNGFSMVTNLPLHIMDDLNQVQRFVAPLYPPVSLFAPQFRFGDGELTSKIDITGQTGSLNTSGSGVDITDFKGAKANSANAANITATLTSLKAVNELPPINVMNWLVVVQKKL